MGARINLPRVQLTEELKEYVASLPPKEHTRYRALLSTVLDNEFPQISSSKKREEKKEVAAFVAAAYAEIREYDVPPHYLSPKQRMESFPLMPREWRMVNKGIEGRLNITVHDHIREMIWDGISLCDAMGWAYKSMMSGRER